MKNLLLSSVALVGLTAGALAADLPSRRAPAPYVAVPVFTWTGFYVGVNAGYGFGLGSQRNFGFNSNLVANGTPYGTGFTNVIAAPGSTFGVGNNANRDGFTGGGQVGYNYQIGQVVLGVEGDIQYTDFGRRKSNFPYGTAVADGTNIGAAGALGNVAFFNGRNSGDYYGTIRARLGYAVDRTLFYVTGGVAFRDTGSNNNAGYFGFTTYAPIKPDDVGYAVGGGVEYAFTPNITGRVEAQYVNFGAARGNNSLGNVVGVTNTNRAIVASTGRGSDDDFIVVRAGVNYKFTTF